MNVVTHHAQGVEFESKLVNGLFERVEKHRSTFGSGEFEFAVIAAGGDVVAVSRFEFSGLSRHQCVRCCVKRYDDRTGSRGLSWRNLPRAAY